MKKSYTLSAIALVVLTFLMIAPLAEAPYAVTRRPGRGIGGAHPLLRGAYRLEENGWIFVHLEDTPFQIGYQHGYLLA